MVHSPDEKLLRIAVFYDGGFFWNVSSYYKTEHPKKAPLSIEGIHKFAEKMVAKEEQVNEAFCRVVESHYFRGRLSAEEANNRNLLMGERTFDDALMKAGVITHYLPLATTGEKGIDVWFALEALELAFYKRFNVIVLISGDGDYVPLLRKLNSLGTRVMVFGWDIQNRAGGARTSQVLLKEANYFIEIDKMIDGRDAKSTGVDMIFYNRNS